MVQMVMIGAGAAALGLAAFLVKASSQPKEFRLERSITTSADADEVYSILSDLARFPEWSPWQKLDPHMTTELLGEQGSVGAGYRWEGNKKVGAGRMTVTELKPGRSVTIKLEFLRPFATTNTTVWQVDEEAEQRRITWIMQGSNDSLFQRAFAMVANMDKMVGKDFEAGLEALKAIVEASSPGDDKPQIKR